MSRKYRDAAAKLQQNVHKHLKEMQDALSSDEEEPCDAGVLEGVLQQYRCGGGDAMAARTRHLLEESLSGRAVTCLICIGSVKRADAIWNCLHCFCCFHLSCIQKWSNDSISLRSEENHGPIAVVRPKKVEWCCPKCRHSYMKDEIPKKYVCFCGKLPDPQLHPWLLPHSCGEVCGRRLSTSENCKHKCLLLCHPGPCPPCPQMVDRACYCEKDRKKVRCSSAKWSCGKQCQNLLSCKSHKCEEICHEYDCSPCTYTSIQACQCGKEKLKRPCNDPDWQCKTYCNKPYSCGFHKCEEVCHRGDCGMCPNSGLRSCPCGANKRYVECPDIMETCLGTCGKMHEECQHTCSVKCHKGPCPPCPVLIEKKCQCGTHTKSLPCSKDYRCDGKCRGIRSCGKHPCARKCCNQNCPPCEKICDKPLQCGRHKCTSVCHRGPCYPCPLESKVTCRCKETSVTVPCGREKYTKPPKCSESCKIKYKCGHTVDNKHSCHFGDCPACKSVCDKEYKCGHRCGAVCHAYVAVTFKQVEKPSTPWEIQAPKTKIMTLDCPPCETPVSVTCFGDHETTSQPCHTSARYPCGRECGRPLPCTNHSCSIQCHFAQPSIEYPNVPSKCEQCNRDCSVPRPEKCVHACPKEVCHSGQCPRCDVIRKIKCHCQLTELFLPCHEFCSATPEKLSCQMQCPKNMECGHRCRRDCHAGGCGGDDECTKKTKVYCHCGNTKKDLPCNTARKTKKIDCDETCENKKLAAKLEKEKEDRRQKELEEERNRRELAEYEWKLSGKKKKYKEKKTHEQKDQRNLLQKHWIPILSVLITVIGIAGVVFLN